MNGARVSSNNWTVDGADNGDRGSNITLLNYSSVDALAEFRVLRGEVDRHAFEPVLHKSADQYSGADRKKYENVRRGTEAERDPFHVYDSAQRVRQMFMDDLKLCDQLRMQ